MAWVGAPPSPPKPGHFLLLQSQVLYSPALPWSKAVPGRALETLRRVDYHLTCLVPGAFDR